MRGHEAWVRGVVDIQLHVIMKKLPNAASNIVVFFFNQKELENFESSMNVCLNHALPQPASRGIACGLHGPKTRVTDPHTYIIALIALSQPQ
ncbi:hypothetical protein RR46_09860 [Papilio xuthus]|uniref:Uncharacterized protein n=1 Tax=Papilio xuthus TaxID=66420 RepID=A0A194QB15_PAPXU|nr:hypothetical protein RR46_09860 [Papilio xuthus]